MKVVSAVVNNPIFIQIQFYTLQKYFKGSEYEFIIFNDAKDFPDFSNGGDITIKQKIENVCKELGIQCVPIPNQKHQTVSCAATRCADSMNFILNYQLQNPDKYLLLDSDMFLISDFDINKYATYDCAVVLQSRFDHQVNYIWNGIYYFDILKMRNKDLLNWNCCNGCDVGGMMQEWLLKQVDKASMPNTDLIRWTNNQYHTTNIYFIKHLWSCSWNMSEMPDCVKENAKLHEFLIRDPRNQNGKFFAEIYDNVFLHYRAGGNWRNESMNLHNFLSEVLQKSLI